MQNRKLIRILRERAKLAIWVAGLTLLASVSTPVEAIAEEGATARTREFIRIRTDDKDRPLSMETATVRYSKKLADGKEVVVDLVGVVHIGEVDYYEQLNKLFEQYDALLYELVAPEGTTIPEGGRQEMGADPLSGLQNGMKEMLGLEFQLDHINYQKENFVHADMSPQEFVESMSKNDESFAKMFFKMLGSSLAAKGGSGQMSDADLVMAMFSSDREMKMRQIMAKQLSTAELSMVAFNGKDGSTIIDHRNGKAFEVLEREIKDGKSKLGVFYGAGHLPDMEERLLKMGFERTAPPMWYVAWRLTRKPLEIVVPPEAEEPQDIVESSPSDQVTPPPTVVEPPPAPASESSSDSDDASATGDAPAAVVESGVPQATGSSAPCRTVQPRRRLFRWRR